MILKCKNTELDEDITALQLVLGNKKVMNIKSEVGWTGALYQRMGTCIEMMFMAH